MDLETDAKHIKSQATDLVMFIRGHCERQKDEWQLLLRIRWVCRRRGEEFVDTNPVKYLWLRPSMYIGSPAPEREGAQASVAINLETGRLEDPYQPSVPASTTAVLQLALHPGLISAEWHIAGMPKMVREAILAASV